ncbi:SRPBCC family protein [Levilactobacillus zymae]|uniref:Uncharacterized protein n=1 Tax=Levilactobacillus zymae TaxID=267363 RepID=A0A1Y6JYI4_9LACO|nr:SRPBCC family protein [Levilactobacillus zymae]QFR60765.1 SRPBCC family protein [Levilactobacillus zymae]GEO70982.1 hypothetical protein LZY01_01500 [Levilactobacillus zymae]SMS14191.1 hypothetical protein LZ3411_1141 [Levilactobacillus zymae]
MTNRLFRLTIMVPATVTQVRQLLLTPERLPQWNPGIGTLTVRPNGWAITRSVPALNRYEILTVTATTRQVVYHSTAGRLTYQLRFDLTPRGTRTQITEELVPTTSAVRGLPLTLLMANARSAFQANLQNLAALMTRTAR